MLTGDVISLIEALTTVKALLKALWLCYHNKQFVYCTTEKENILKKVQREKKKMKNLHQNIYIMKIINI